MSFLQGQHTTFLHRFFASVALERLEHEFNEETGKIIENITSFMLLKNIIENNEQEEISNFESLVENPMNLKDKVGCHHNYACPIFHFNDHVCSCIICENAKNDFLHATSTEFVGNFFVRRATYKACFYNKPV